MRNFDPAEVGIFNVASKPLPFRKKMPKRDRATYQQIVADLKTSDRKTFVIDDSQYLLVFEEFNRAGEMGYAKFTEMAQHFYLLIKVIIEDLQKDKIVYFLHHTDVTEDGRTKAKTIGKMLDSKLTLEGLFSIVLLANTDGTDYWFETRNDGFNTVKTPMEMFEDARIPNDLKLVDTAIREYYKEDFEK